MEIVPAAHEIIAYLSNHKDQLTEWEENFISGMTYWLKVRNKEPTHAQLMMMSIIYNRVKRIY